MKPIPIGIEYYKKMIDEEFMYIDKTWLIRDLLEQKSQVVLFVRPRRFGKTLAQTMLQTFFEKEFGENGTVIDNSRYFHGMKIMEAGEQYTRHIGQYPVIFLSLKSAKQPTFALAYSMIKRSIAEEYKRHIFVKEQMENRAEKKRFERISLEEGDTTDYIDSLEFLSKCLEKYYKKKCVILIDEYDVPLENAYFCGFYDKMVEFTRSLFESALKTNSSLERAVITGCLRISKESIFTGLNNFEVVSVLNHNYAEHFGFIQSEVDNLFRFYGIESKLEEAKQWYNGYLFGNVEVYNPWSVIHYTKDHIYEKEQFPKPYWSNTSSNHIVRELIEKADMGVKQELENLLAGRTIKKPVHEDITYADIYKSQDNFWNFLFFTGYLKKITAKFENDQIYLIMKIPNREIAYIYRNCVLEWFREKTDTIDFSKLYFAILDENAKTFENILSEYLMESISYFDYDEGFYHGFMVGILKGCQNYIVKSNRESGMGRPDILMKYASIRGKAVIMEFKYAKTYDEMENKCEEAILQIEKNCYDTELKAEGYRNILKYGICFCKKECKVKLAEK